MATDAGRPAGDGSGYLFATAQDGQLGVRRQGVSAVLEWVSEGVAVVGGQHADTAVLAMAREVRASPGVVVVVGLPPSGVGWARLNEAVAMAVPRDCVVLVAVSDAGGPTADGVAAAAAAAAALAQRLCTTVQAPDGPVMLLPGGTLFAPGGWLRFQPDVAGVPAGCRYPAPDWEPDLDVILTRPEPGLCAVPVPAGVWLFPEGDGHAGGRPELTAHAYSAPMDPHTVMLMVGMPGGQDVAPEPIVASATRLPESVRTRLLLVPYGQTGRACVAAARTLSRRWGWPVPVATGVPVLDNGGQPVALALDPDGTAWRQLVNRLEFRPTGPGRPSGEVAALRTLPSAGPGTYRLNDHWVVEVSQFGLWVRPPDAGGAAQVHQMAWDPARPVILVGLPGVAPDRDVLPLVAGLLARLPLDLRRRIAVAPRELFGIAVAPAARSVPPRPAAPAPVGQPDLVVAFDGRGQAPGWWRAEPRLFSVLASYRPDGAGFVAESGTVTAAMLAELVAGHPSWRGRPVLLVTTDPVPLAALKRCADQLQSVVIGRLTVDGDWLAVQPRNLRTDAAVPARLGTGYPLTDAAWTRLRMQGSSVPLATLTPPPGLLTDTGVRLDTTSSSELPPVSEPPRALAERTFVVSVGRTDEPAQPFRIMGDPCDGWQVARAVWAWQEHWSDPRCQLCVDAGSVRHEDLQLLANYLGAVLAAPAGSVTDRIGPDIRRTEWIRVAPRLPQPAAVPPAVPTRTVSTEAGAAGGSPRGTDVRTATAPPVRTGTALPVPVINGPPAGGTQPVPDEPARPGEPHPAPPPPDPVPLPGAALVPGTLRALLDWRYDVHSRSVARMLAARPGLRGSGDNLVEGLIAVCAFLGGEIGQAGADGHALDGARGSGSVLSVTDPVLLTYIEAGLERLPFFRGRVTAWSNDAGGVTDYPAGRTIDRRYPMVASTSAAPARATGTELVIWSVSGRRVDGLAPGAANLVVFVPGTQLEVLEAEQLPDGTVRVYLAEGDSGSRDADRQAGAGSPAMRLVDRLREGGPG